MNDDRRTETLAHLMSLDKHTLATLVLRLSKQHEEWRNMAISLGWEPTPVTSDEDDDSQQTGVSVRVLKDNVIDALIELRMALAKQEGIKDWENDSEGGGTNMDSPITSGDAQEMIWGLDL